LALAMFFLSSTVVAQEKIGKAGNTPIARPQMLNFLETALAGHRAELAKLQAQLERLEALKVQILADMGAYDAQNTTHSQLLLMPQPRMDDLTRAVQDNRLAAHTIAEKITVMQRRFTATALLFNRIDGQIELAREQFDSIRQTAMSDGQKQQLEHAADELVGVLRQKKQLAERYQEGYEAIAARVNTELDAVRALGEKLALRMEESSKSSLFARSESSRQILGDELWAALDHLIKRIGLLISYKMWRSQVDALARVGAFRWTVFLLLVVICIALRGRFKHALKRIEEERQGEQWYYRRLAVVLLQRSISYLAVTFLLGIFAAFELSYIDIGLRRVLFFISLFLLYVRWALDFLAFGLSGPETKWRIYIRQQLAGFFKFLRIVMIAAIVLIWVAGFDSLLTSLLRDGLSIVFFIWAIVFWHGMQTAVARGAAEGQQPPSRPWSVFTRWWSFLFLGGTVLLHITGYGNLADHWFTAWIKTAALIFWAYIVLNAMREWRRGYRAAMAARNEEHLFSRSDDIQRPLIQLALLIWFVSLLAGLIWAWDRAGFLYSHLEVVFNFTFAIGSLQLSVWGIVSAGICLWGTSLAVQFWRALLSRSFLKKRPLEQGLKDTVLTLTSYLAWGLGLLLALGILGFNATSLTVILGALSVGIGFGLQNIFNNLVSGLILLFERPIQKGDIIEIKDLWAEVKEINVRATLVQTFDNASVIIPNSELISQQVTNWSFKDKRLRRNIDIGVAYGSDIDLVQKTLLDIARDTPDVLKYPQPDVLFTDHADSALIFRLRLWLYVQDFWAVPSLVRGEIDRRFRQLGVEIAYPQRDLHIRTMPGEKSLPGLDPESGTGRPAGKQKTKRSHEPGN